MLLLVTFCYFFTRIGTGRMGSSESKDLNNDELGSPTTSSWYDVFNIEKRWKQSNLKYFIVTGPTREEVDSIMNTLSLLSALLLTIPYSVVVELNHEYFDYIESRIETCQSDYWQTYTAEWLLAETKANLLLTMIPAIFSLLVTVAYYVLRPSDLPNRSEELDAANFTQWWQRGKYIPLIIFIAVTISIWGAYLILFHLVNFYVNSTSEFCKIQTGNTTFYTINAFCAILFIVCCLIML